MSPDDTTKLKKCTKCGEEYPATTEYFNIHTKSRGNLRADCKECQRKYIKNYYVSHLDVIRSRAIEWNKNHPAEARARIKKWEKNHPEKNRLKLANWRRNHPDEWRAQTQRRRARKAGAGGSFTAEDIKKAKKLQKNHCWWCGKKLKTTETPHTDHRIPLARGGSNDISNIVLACPHCNLSKNDKLPHEWSDRLL